MITYNELKQSNFWKELTTKYADFQIEESSSNFAQKEYESDTYVSSIIVLPQVKQIKVSLLEEIYEETSLRLHIEMLGSRNDVSYERIKHWKYFIASLNTAADPNKWTSVIYTLSSDIMTRKFLFIMQVDDNWVTVYSDSDDIGYLGKQYENVYRDYLNQKSIDEIRDDGALMYTFR